MSVLYCDPNKRHDFVYFFDVTNGNPNGDPDAGNMPRVDPETMHGIVTDVCTKRKVRDYVSAVLNRPIFIQSEIALNTLCRTASDESGKPVLPAVELDLSKDDKLKPLLDAEDSELADWLTELSYEGLEFDPDSSVITYSGDAVQKKAFEKEVSEGVESEAVKKAIPLIAAELAKRSKKVKLTAQSRAALKDAMIRGYFDIRMFGAVLTVGTNAGQVRGPMQMTFARSIDPIQPRDLSITRIAITKPSDATRKQTEMGRKAIVPYGLYRLHGFFNPLLGRSKNAKGEMEQVLKPEDLANFWDALQNLFTFDRSAARGEMCVRGLYVFTHENERGNAPAHKLFELVSVKPCSGSAREFGAYASGIDTPPSGPVTEYPGVTLTALTALKPDPVTPPESASGA
jgi:CRISPR-associated protein Csd2